MSIWAKFLKLIETKKPTTHNDVVESIVYLCTTVTVNKDIPLYLALT